jgi:lactoylglutathione lyase
MSPHPLPHAQEPTTVSTIEITGMNVLAVYVADLEQAVTFYTEQLGFERGEEMSPGVLLRAGDVTLYLEAGRRARESASREFPEFSPCFATASVKESYAALKSADVTIVEEYQEYAPTFALFKIADPDGNLIEFAGQP